MKILNLGAGNRIIENADNHDIIRHRPEINLVFDLDEIWHHSLYSTDFEAVWKNQIDRQISFAEYDEIQFISVIEHLSITPIQALDQCWHLLKSSGKLIIKYPHYTSVTAYHDPTHKHWLTENSLDYVDPNTQFGKDYNYYTQYKWQILTPPENRLIIKGGNRVNVKMELIPKK